MRIEAVVVENLEKRYKDFRLRIDRLSLNKGFNLVVGPNGAGKSTFLKLLAGFVRPLRGSIKFVAEGRALGVEEAQKLLSYVAEDVMFPNMRVSDLLESFSRSRKDLEIVIETLGLEPYLRKRYFELSSGFRKRVQIAIAMLRDANVILLDEPFTNVDTATAKVLRKLIDDWRRDRIVVVASHIDPGIVPDNMVVIDQGAVVYAGKPEKVLSRRIVFRVKVGDKVHELDLNGLNKLLSREGIVIESVNILSFVEYYD